MALDLSRRRFLGMTAGTIAFPALIRSVSGRAMAAGPRNCFRAIIVPDIQIITERYPEYLLALKSWLLDIWDDGAANGCFFLGDLVNNPADDAQWDRLNEAFLNELKENKVMVLSTRGNHDEYWKGSMVRQKFAEATAFTTSQPHFGGYLVEGDPGNAYHIFSGAHAQWLVVTLGFSPSLAALQRAREVIDAHPDHNAIVVPHSLLLDDNTFHGSKESHPWTARKSEVYGKLVGDAHDGVDVWNEVMRPSKNVFAGIGGHVLGTGRGFRTDPNDFRHPVASFLANFQHTEGGGQGKVVIMEAYPDEGMMTFKTFCPCTRTFSTRRIDAPIRVAGLNLAKRKVSVMAGASL